MESKEQENINEIHSFLENNGIDHNNLVGYNNKFSIFYYVGDSRKFAEETRVVFNADSTGTILITLNEINFIEFETEFKTTQNRFSYDDESETLTINGTDSDKHTQEYKVVINSIYLDF